MMPLPNLNDLDNERSYYKFLRWSKIMIMINLEKWYYIYRITYAYKS